MSRRKKRNFLNRTLPTLCGFTDLIEDDDSWYSNSDKYIRKRVEKFKKPLTKPVIDDLERITANDIKELAAEILHRMNPSKSLESKAGMLRVIGHFAKKLVEAEEFKEVIGYLVDIVSIYLPFDFHPQLRVYAAMAYSEIRKELLERHGRDQFTITELSKVVEVMKVYENRLKEKISMPSVLEIEATLIICDQVLRLDCKVENLKLFGLKVFDKIFSEIETGGNLQLVALNALSGLLTMESRVWVLSTTSIRSLEILRPLEVYLIRYMSRLALKSSSAEDLMRKISAFMLNESSSPDLAAFSNYNESENKKLIANKSEFIRLKIKSFRADQSAGNKKLMKKFEATLSKPELLMRLIWNTLDGSKKVEQKDGLLALLGMNAGELVKQYEDADIFRLLNSNIFPLIELSQDLQIRTRAAWVYSQFRSHMKRPDKVLLSQIELLKSARLLSKLSSLPSSNSLVFLKTVLVETIDKFEYGQLVFDSLYELMEDDDDSSEVLDVLNTLLNDEPIPWDFKEVSFLELYSKAFFDLPGELTESLW